ncbi:MAG: hypothetical protein C6H99_01925 [Epsilonproteobacteria bacterium]|nr:hypothetical protein [Campylobacterota bacterium]NPA63840.1 helix-turn-helix domain-containing protein [Campylobacterota bacterium]
MSDFDRLKQMDPQEIYQKTFMLPKVIKALLEEEYDKLGNKTKALGFVTILERELDLDLSELKDKIAQHFDKNAIEYSKAFEITEKEHKGSSLWIFTLLALLLGVGGYVYFTKEAPKEPSGGDSFLDSSSASIISSLSQSSSSSSASLAVLDRNESNGSLSSASQELLESNQTQTEQKMEQNGTQSSHYPSNPPAPISLTLIPKKRVWVGIISLDDHSKRSLIISKPIELNVSKDQLIVTGHGLVEFDIDGQIKEFDDRGKLYFIYRAGELEQIDKKSFKRYNKGRSW